MAEGVTSSLDVVAQEVADLRDVFTRRLLNDRAQARAVELLKEQLREANRRLEQRALDPVFRELLLLVDRLEHALGMSEVDLADLVQSAVEEVLEVMARRGLVPVPTDGTLDPRVHQVVATAPGGEPGHLVEVRRAGWMIEDRLLRPAQVVVTTAEDGDD